jgi:hypothetical protein
METDLIQDGGQVKRQTDIDHHGPKYNLIICHLPDPPTFSLPTTFKLGTYCTLRCSTVQLCTKKPYDIVKSQLINTHEKESQKIIMHPDK